MREVLPGTSDWDPGNTITHQNGLMKNTDHTECWQGCGRTEFSHTLLVGI